MGAGGIEGLAGSGTAPISRPGVDTGLTHGRIPPQDWHRKTGIRCHARRIPGSQLAANWGSEHVWAMVAALKMPSRHMTVAEFLDWDSGDRSGALWQLRDGEPELMAPASDAHGSIQARLAYLLSAHLDARGGGCRVVVAPGVIPRVRSAENCLVPDLGITCVPPSGGRMLPEPVVLIEILSPSNEADTRANVWAYTTIPSVVEILLVRTASMEAELLRRGADGSWPAEPDTVGADGILRLDSIEFAEPLRSAYRTTALG
jgi:Uma2 family endonuclease